MLPIKKAELVISAVSPTQYPPAALPEIPLVGRSNVGKSSLINRFLNRRNLARTSSRPGKTQTINFYLINDAWYFVDLPGYGYAQVSHQAREQWRVMIEKYLTTRTVISEIWQLVDLRHPPSKGDMEMNQWLKHYNFSNLVIGTKADKISKNQRGKHASVICQELGIKKENFIIFSAETGEGRELLVDRVAAVLG